MAATRKYWAWNKKFRNEPPEPITFGKTGQEFIKYLKSEPLLKGILAGHLHITVEERFSPTAVQYLMAGAGSGDAGSDPIGGVENGGEGVAGLGMLHCRVVDKSGCGCLWMQDRAI